MTKFHDLELLSPAANKITAIEAIKHGSDAVYIGATSFGARKNASNTLDDIAETVEFAHQYRSRVYVTVNTIIYGNELKEVRQLCIDLYHLGVDALIVQDMGLLRLNLPPIALHASTQCDIRTPEKALFLQEVGFSQIVLERSLSLDEIKKITETVDIPVECFVHGALCVSYSGRCHASYAVSGKSANRGECRQICRLPFDLLDSQNNIIVSEKHLLSLKDLNQSESLEALIKAGVSSFKIEGRLKDVSYVKNITSFYNNKLNDFIKREGDRYKRSSFGTVELKFNPDPKKSFNRDFTSFFLLDRHNKDIYNPITPKSIGEPIQKLSDLNNGDGISYIDKNGKFTGLQINKIESGKIFSPNKINLPSGTRLYRTFDNRWQKLMNSQTASRKINIKIFLQKNSISAEDEMGNKVILPLDFELEPANKKQDYKPEFEKLGNTIYKLKQFIDYTNGKYFIPLSKISRIRRQLLNRLDFLNRINYKFDYRREENKEIKYFLKETDYKENISNSLAEDFYRSHGVNKIEYALEKCKSRNYCGKVIMTTRHCILKELGKCKKMKGPVLHEPLYLKNGNIKYKLEFDCKKCEMKVLV